MKISKIKKYIFILEQVGIKRMGALSFQVDGFVHLATNKREVAINEHWTTHKPVLDYMLLSQFPNINLVVHMVIMGEGFRPSHFLATKKMIGIFFPIPP